MNIYVDNIRIQINGKPATVSDLEELPAPYDVRLVMLRSDLLLVEVRYPSQLV